MKTREPLYPEFEISRTLQEFHPLPCPPPCGKDVLERFFGILHETRKDLRSCNSVALQVATELHDLWERGDARIPRNKLQTIKKKVVDFREDLRRLCKKSKKGTPGYQATVSLCNTCDV